MKKIYLLLTLTSLIVVNACEDKLDIPQQGMLNMETYYSTPEDAKEALAALYSTWANTHVSSDYSCKNVMADDLYSGGNGPADGQDFAYLSRAFYEPSTGSISTMYKGLYSTINRANLILDAFGEDTSNPDIKLAVAEARFFRAWCYIELVTLWGTPPLVKRVLSADESKVPNTPAEETWKFIEDELKAAINSGALTEKQSATDPHAGIRPTKQTAQAYLGKAYLFQGKYADAWEQFDAVIKSGKYALAQAVDYVNLFHLEGNYSSEYLLSNNTVNDFDPAKGKFVSWLFAIMYNWIWGNSYFTMHNSGQSMNFFGGYFDIVTGSFVANVDITQGYGFLNPTGKVYEKMIAIGDNTADPFSRLNRTLITHDRMHSEVGIWLEGNSQHFEHEGYYRLKYLARKSDMYPFTGWVGCAINLPAMRYAEVLLMAAEAGFKTSKPEALGYFNQVRERAKAPTVSSLTMQLIQDEFFVETSFEGHRFQDLQRWDKNGDIDMVEVLKNKGKQNVYFTTQPPTGNEPYQRVRTAFTNESWIYYVPATESRAGFEAYEKLLPFPQTELDVNPNIVQNTGWDIIQ
jgi:tetratricopeptide (TPR) repeat protein